MYEREESARHAYASLLCGGDRYLPGVEALGRSLLASGTTADMILMVTADVPEAARRSAQAEGWTIREVEPIANPRPPSQQMMARFTNVFTKLRAWEIEPYERVVFLDADTLVLANVDELFERPTFAAAPDFFLPDRFNSGVMVLTPSVRRFAAMMDALAIAPSYDGGDQGFLNTFFPWWDMSSEHRLGVGYNMPNFIYQFMRAHPVVREQVEHEAKIVHFLVQKPWLAKATLTGASALWWRRYYEVHPERERTFSLAAHDGEDVAFARMCRMVME